MQDLTGPVRVSIQNLPNLGLNRTFFLARVGYQGAAPCEVLGSSRESALRAAVRQFRSLRTLRALRRAVFYPRTQTPVPAV